MVSPLTVTKFDVISDVAVAGQSSSTGHFASLPPMPDNLYPRPANSAPTVYHIVEVSLFSFEYLFPYFHLKIYSFFCLMKGFNFSIFLGTTTSLSLEGTKSLTVSELGGRC